jgi:hypothetical protein
VLKSGKLSCELELYLPFGVLALKEVGECVFVGDCGDGIIWVKDGGGTAAMACVEGRIGERMTGGVLGGDIGPRVCVIGLERPMLTMDHWSLEEDERMRVGMGFMCVRSFEPAGLLEFGTSKIVESVKRTAAG